MGLLNLIGSISVLLLSTKSFKPITHKNNLQIMQPERLEQSIIRMQMQSSYNPAYLGRLVDRKKIIVDGLLRRHQDADDPLVMRLCYMASVNHFNITKSLLRPAFGPQSLHTLSVTVDMKRKSPTIPSKRNIVEFSHASKFSELLAQIHVDGLLINLEESEYGGSPSDLKECINAVREIRPYNPPICIAKDIFIHPVQIAQAVENGASGVLLIAAIVGADLETLLDSCTLMGIEALVEVHTPNELDYALSVGATLFLINQWDRATGILHPNQAKVLSSMLPLSSVAVVGGNIKTVEEAVEFGYYGYDGIVLGRNLAELPDIKGFIDGVHAFTGPPRNVGLGMKGFHWAM